MPIPISDDGHHLRIKCSYSKLKKFPLFKNQVYKMKFIFIKFAVHIIHIINCPQLLYLSLAPINRKV